MYLTLVLVISSPLRTVLLLLIRTVNSSKVAEHMLVGHASSPQHETPTNNKQDLEWDGDLEVKIGNKLRLRFGKDNFFFNLINTWGGSSFAIDRR